MQLGTRQEGQPGTGVPDGERSSGLERARAKPYRAYRLRVELGIRRTPDDSHFETRIRGHVIADPYVELGGGEALCRGAPIRGVELHPRDYPIDGELVEPHGHRAAK